MVKTSTKSFKTFGEKRAEQYEKDRYKKRAEQYEKDRYKLGAGIKFVITRIVDIKELTNFSVVLIDGQDIQGEPVKYYASGKAIVNQCKELLSDASPDGTLNEPIEVEVIIKKGTKSEYSYPSFRTDIPIS